MLGPEGAPLTRFQKGPSLKADNLAGPQSHGLENELHRQLKGWVHQNGKAHIWTKARFATVHCLPCQEVLLQILALITPPGDVQSDHRVTALSGNAA